METIRQIPGKKQLFFRLLFRLTTWIGFSLITLLAIPTGLLLLVTAGVWFVTDSLMARFQQKGEG